MREIKFRLWDKDTKRMLYQTDIEYYNDMIGFRFDSNVLVGRKNIVIMQYIGIRGKLQVEMYHGDIFLYNKEKYIVSFHKGAWIANQVNKSFFFNLFTEFSVKKINKQYYCDEYEVIGNIYETPELLESLDYVYHQNV